jgi:plastocyanin
MPGLAFGGAAVEGTVALPKAAPPVAAARYQNLGAVEPAQPDPPAAVVYVEGASAPQGSAASAADVAQQGFQFSPGLLAIRRGTTVRFPNRDPEYHSVFSYSKAKRFDLGRYSDDEKPAELLFDQTGVVKLYCEIHDHMRGTILVVDTPHFAKTDAEGRYRLENLPAGRYVLKAWLDEDDVREHAVELRGGETAHVDFPAP